MKWYNGFEHPSLGITSMLYIIVCQMYLLDFILKVQVHLDVSRNQTVRYHEMLPILPICSVYIYIFLYVYIYTPKNAEYGRKNTHVELAVSSGNLSVFLGIIAGSDVFRWSFSVGDGQILNLTWVNSPRGGWWWMSGDSPQHFGVGKFYF